ncbi:phosphate ABC transporter substrate-binding protein [Microcoleus sp. CAWBG640]|uniref:phosphate ABC transporter substrate-binding protein n=1 Tax=Microcoleus sp. CAWBG640 TaxID=2841653 RepID=UPI00312B636E
MIPTPSPTPAPTPIPNIVTIDSIDTSQPNPQVLTMDGSVTMVKMIKLLRNGYAQVNPNIPTTYGFDVNGEPKDGEDVRPTGSASGLKNLIDGKVLMVATSRPLKPEEAKAEVKIIPIARDAITIVIGKDNPFQGSLTKAQLRDIYTGKITNWSEVGGANLPIKVYNRSPDSGTRGFFQDDVLLAAKFAPDGENFKTWERDETTAVLRVLGNDGIYYTTVSQAEHQNMIRIVPIDGINPENKKAILDRTYPMIRDVYLAVPKQSSPAVKQFVEFALSPEGQRIVEQAEFIRLK